MKNDEEYKLLGLDPSILSTLSESDREGAINAALAAKRAEERAEQKALAAALEEQKKRRQQYQQRQQEALQRNQNILLEGLQYDTNGSTVLKRKSDVVDEQDSTVDKVGLNGSIKFVSKREREKHNKIAQIQNKELVKDENNKAAKNQDEKKSQDLSIRPSTQQTQTHLTQSEILDIKKSYLGRDAILDEEERRRVLEQKKKKRKIKGKTTFKFEWEPTEDTLAQDDTLYALDISKLKNGGANRNGGKSVDILGSPGKRTRTGPRQLAVTAVDTVMAKPISQMNARDWRIFRENFDIRVRGGRAPPPLRSFRELPASTVPPIHPMILDAIENVLMYKEPSPIQRQAIPLGLQRRDLIAIAETGSGKTAAFGIPLCHYILNLPKETLEGVADHGPLALVMAPTRELALQIDAEIGKLLSKQTDVTTLAIVGGQSIQEQAYKLRNGAHIVVGTPGRLNECIEMAYLVLNQCSYVVLDEADRMIDLGFAPQIDSILESMGGSLKSEDEVMAYQQEEEDLKSLHKGVPLHRLTAMFSATMPLEVERIAKKYLRHPAMVSIGDSDSVKNSRIVQNVLFLSSAAQKEGALRDILLRNRDNQKIIVFVNEKKHAEGVARMVENAGRECVVLHGGKAQEQREENLEAFRKGGVVLVATDVAGRGLDILDVAHVINFDLPSKIENYTHRIGRTGRAGKEGIATSFLTDADEGIMAPLKSYLLSTGNHVPEKLSRHPAAAGVSSGPFY